MVSPTRYGGIAALVQAASYVAAFVILLALLVPAGYPTGEVAAGEAAEFTASHQGLLFVWILIIYLIVGSFMVVLALALLEPLRTGSAFLAQVAAAFGLIWAGLILASGMIWIGALAVVGDLFDRDAAEAETVWTALDTVADGLGGAIELPGGIWVLLVSWAALAARQFPKALNWLGLLIGVVGILTVIPPLGELASVFGVLLIVWFTWLGIILIRRDPATRPAQAAPGTSTL
jgi:hypothetical protein